MSEYQVGDTIDHMTNISGFHSKEGLFFKRVNDGDVRVQKWSTEKPFTILSSVIIDMHTWASVVASVSFDGENSKSSREALEFHERGNGATIVRPIDFIPQEPEGGCFALTGTDVVANTVEDSPGIWRGILDNEPKSWPEIYPHIVKLYTPSGDLVTGFEYAGGGE